MSLKFRRVTVARLLLGTSVLLFAGCGAKTDATAAGGKGGGKGGKGGKGSTGPAPVLVAQVQRRVVPLVVDAIGAVEPVRSTAVRSQITGLIEKIAFKEGQDVKEGDLLFQIDPRPFRGALNAAMADLQKAKVQLETARSQVTRYRALSADQMVSKEQYQKIQDEARTAEADVQAAESRVSNAKLQLEFSSIRAPLSGRTGNLSVDEGDLVRGNDTGPLVTINQLNPIYVTFGVPQQYLGAINRYRAERALPVKVVPPGNEEQPESGTLTFVDNMVDSATGTIRLKGTFSNENHRLWPGQFAAVTLTLTEPEVLVVPSSAVQNSQTGQHVYVVSADRIAEQRSVVIERTHESNAVVTSGLKEGETVVVDGQLRVIPGRGVEIKPPAGAATGKAGETAKGKGKEGKKKKDT
jgi:membrane fusion protein, multidrug efflux system